MDAPTSWVSRNPARRNSLADWEEASGQPMLIVPSTAPAATAPRPSTAWPYVGRNVVGPITSRPRPSAASAEPLSTRRRQNHGGMIGSAARRSMNTAPAAAATAVPNTARLGADHHGQATPPCSRPRMRAPPATNMATAPATSIRCRVRRTFSCR